MPISHAQIFGNLGMLLPIDAIVGSHEDKVCQTGLQGIAQILRKVVCMIDGFLAQEQAEVPQKSRVLQKLILTPIDPDGVAFTACDGRYPSGGGLGTQQLDLSNKAGRIQKADERNTAILVGQK